MSTPSATPAVDQKANASAGAAPSAAAAAPATAGATAGAPAVQRHESEDEKALNCEIIRGKSKGRKVVAFLDGSTSSQTVLECAIEWMNRNDDDLFIVHILPIPQYKLSLLGVAPKFYSPQQKVSQEEHEASLAFVRAASKIAEDRGVKHITTQILTVKSPKEAAVEYASALGANLVVCGTRGFGAVKKAIVGSFSSFLVAECSCPVVVAK